MTATPATRPDANGNQPAEPAPGDRLLEIADLNVVFHSDSGIVHAVNGVTFGVSAGETVALVGESGSGKSVTAMSLLQLLPATAEIKGSVEFLGEELLTAPDKRMRQVRGGEISMIFQDPLTALNPVHRVGRQIEEMYRSHNNVSHKESRARAIEMLGLVGIPQPAKRVDQYPHEYSGGMRQRAMIAMALACDPKLIIADEPTTALDVTVQAQVLELLVDLSTRLHTAVLLITHDLGVVAGMAQRVVVMYAGRLVERGTTDEIFDETAHPYTSGLLRSLPKLTGDVDEPLMPIAGQPPSMLNPPPGCAFHPRCPFALEAAGCMTEVPDLVERGPSLHAAACHRTDELLAQGLLGHVEVNT